jgi:hypothetical protein
MALTRFSLSRSAKLSKCVSCRLMRISLDLLNQHLPDWIPAKFALENVDGLYNHDIRVHGDITHYFDFG